MAITRAVVKKILRSLEMWVLGILGCQTHARIVAQVFAGLLKVISTQLLMTILEMSEKSEIPVWRGLLKR